MDIFAQHDLRKALELTIAKVLNAYLLPITSFLEMSNICTSNLGLANEVSKHLKNQGKYFFGVKKSVSFSVVKAQKVPMN